MQVFFAADHAGFALKAVLMEHLALMGHIVEDMGAYTLDPDDDYPDVVIPLATRVAETPGSFGVVLGGSGQGEAMAANRVHSARALVWYGGSVDIVRVAREHNDANILSLGARLVTEVEAVEAVQIFLATEFSEKEHHIRRIKKLDT